MVLAVLHVCTCAIMWKLSTLPATSTPWPVLQLLFVNSMRRAFWFKLMNRSHCNRSLPKRNHRNTNFSIICTPDKECAQFQEAHTATGEFDNKKNNSEEVNLKPHSFDGEDLISWVLVAHGINRLTTAAYLLGNALVFVLYLFPLLFRIFEHSSFIEYVVDND